MSTIQDISSADSLIPNGNFVQGVSYWAGDVRTEGIGYEHYKFFLDHENANPKKGEPKYGIKADRSISCRLNRNDLFMYPILRYLPGVTAVPIKKNAILITQTDEGDFWVEDVDWATPYTAVLNNAGDLHIIIDRETVIRRGTELVWISPTDGEEITVVVQSEDRSARGVDYRAFVVAKKDSTPFTSAETGATTEEPFGDSVLHFVVRARPQPGSTLTLWAQDDTYSGHYVISSATDTEIVAVPEDQNLALIAQNGDVDGLVYTRVEGDASYTLRVLGGTLSVSPGDYFVALAPAWAYGRVNSVQVTNGVQVISVSASDRPLPVTGVTASRAVTNWAFAPAISGDLEVPIPGCRYELTLAFTADEFGTWGISLQFITEKGASQGLATVIDSMEFEQVRSFPVSDGSSFTRYIYKLQADRPLPVGGLPRLRFEYRMGGLQMSHIVMYRGDFTGQADDAEPLPVGEFEQLEFTTSPDGGMIPKGTIVAFTGGTNCPPGFSEVVGYPGDAESPSNVIWETDELHNFDRVTYDASKDVTTIVLRDEDFPLSVASQDSFSSYPWSSTRVLSEIVKRDPPSPPRYRIRIRIDGIRITLLDTTLPSPPPRPPRFDYVNIGLLKPAIYPGMFLQIIPNADSSKFIPFKPDDPEGLLSCLIVGLRIAPDFVAYESGSSADPIGPYKTYPSSYNNLATDLSLWSIIPSPFGILTAISTLKNIYENIRRVALYDPRRTGEPLPATYAAPIEGGKVNTYLDLQGDWREMFNRRLGRTSKVRIIKTGYLKMDADEPGFAEIGSEEHNHRIEPSDDLTPIQPSNVYQPDVASITEKNLPPVLAGHGHNYLGAGGYSRPRARVVKLCVKD